MPKISNLTSTTITNSDGEILSKEESTTWNFGREPDYIKVYLEDVMVLAEVQGWVSKILYELVKSVSYANKGQFIVINAGYKRILADTLKIKPQSVTNAINQLVKKNILIKKESGVFLLNPQYFGKGDWKDISKIRYEVEIGKFGKKVHLKEVEQTEEQIKEEPQSKAVSVG